MIASELLALVRDNVEDPPGDFTPDDYVYRRLNMAQMMLTDVMLTNPNIGALLSFVELSDVPIGTTSLKVYFGTGQALNGLREVMSMKERPVSGTRGPGDYMPMGERNDIPSSSLGTFNEIFVPLPDDILLPGANQAMDLKILGKFDPPKIVDGDSPIISGTSTYLSFKAAALIAAPRTASGPLYMFNESQAQLALDGILRTIIMEKQNNPARMNSYNRSRTFRR